jgi:peroxiredoxin
MSNATVWSRIVLGALVLTALALIVVVAMSRPDAPEQGSQLLSAADDDTGRDSPTESAAPADDPTKSADVMAPETTTQQEAVTANSEASSADDTASKPETNRQRASTSKPLTAPDSADRDSTPATNRHKQNATGSKSMPKEDAETASTEAASKEAAPKEAAPASRASAALQRLSREFARRAAAGRDPDKVKARPVAPPAHEVFQPNVVMSQAHRATCLVYVGDPLPAGTLKTVTGEEISILDALGPRLTAIVFWNAGNPYALDQFEELKNDLVPFHNLGVESIAIHVGTPPENYEQLCQQHGAGVLCLTDADESYFSRVSTGSVPRTYLFDADGKIIWLDIEYSRTTRYDLRNALHYSLQDQTTTRKVNRPAR